MIRLAEHNDIPFLYPVLIDFFEYSNLGKWGLTADKLSVMKTISHLINNDDSVVFVSEKNNKITGSAAATNANWFGNFNQFKAQELWLWIDPDHRGRDGLRLLDGLIEWAKKMKVTSLMLISLPNKDRSKVERLYRLRGFEPTEIIHERKI